MKQATGKTVTAFKAFLESTFELTLKSAPNAQVKLNHLSLDSRKIKSNDVFIALQGEQTHGLKYLAQVLVAKPSVIIADRALTDIEEATVEAFKAEINEPISIWIIPNIKNNLGVLGDWFYNAPSSQIKVVGITGTNGKTSSAFYTAQLLELQGKKVALMGTLGNGAIHALQPTQNTTPDAIQVHRLLSEFLEQGFQWVVMEVSSHALCLGRVQAVKFNTVAMTQVTRDHIDFHGTVEAYRQAKMRLFTDYQADHRIVNLADSTGQKIAAELAGGSFTSTRFTYSAKEPQTDSFSRADMQLEYFKLNQAGFSGQLAVAQSKERFKATLMGAFNLENLFCALAILYQNQFELPVLLRGVEQLKSVLGRMQVVHHQPTVIVDFAHTPDALEQVLQAVKAHGQAFEVTTHGQQEHKLSLVFGCGGDRDKGKRPLMAKVAEKYVDTLILTSDNPRTESPKRIIEEICVGVSDMLVNQERLQIEERREKAIVMALAQAKSDDIVIIAGKGHEDYQEIDGVKYPFSDIKVIQQFYAAT